MKTPEQRENDMLKAAKNYAQQYEGLMYTIGSIAGVSGIRMAFERGVHFGLHQALDITVEREKAERNAEQHWISVEDRLPEYDQLALLWQSELQAQFVGRRVDSGLAFPLYYWECASDFFEAWKEIYYPKLMHQGAVSHWMPLPEPPKE